jgi:phosphopantetheine adenylyltransferase
MKVQIDDLVREANAEEIAAHEKRTAEQEAKIAAEAKRAKDKAALLDRLGITAEEAALLLS